MDRETMDQVNDGYVSIPRLLKGALVKMLTLGANLIQLRQTLGNDKFADFVRTRLPFDLAEAELFMRLAATPGLDAAKFTPPVAVAMPRLLGVYDQILGMWSTINGGSAPEPKVAATATEGTTATTTTETPSVTDEVAPADVPAGNDHVADKEPAGAAITDILSGITTPVAQADATADYAPAAAEATPPRRPRLTAEQHQYLRDRSVTLLVKVNRGELTVEAAMRQAEKMPKRKTN